MNHVVRLPVPETEPESPERPLLLVTVGTDHHPFNRVIEWIDRWLADGAAEKVRCLVQHGTSQQAAAGDNHAYLDHDQLQEAMSGAAAVVCHAGPATIAEARRTGHLPIVVPRDPAYGEHVDDHQLRFTRRVGADDLVVHAESEWELRKALEATVADPERLRLPRPEEMARGDAPVARSVRHAAALIDGLIGASASDSPGAALAQPGPAPGSERTEWPTVSVIIPTKDRPELVREAIDSVLSQDYPGEVECLVVFDGTDPDRTLATSNDHRRVSVTRNTRTPGLAGGRNSGIVTASGELIAFCDDDDTWLAGKLRAQVEALERTPGAAVVCCGIRVDYGATSVDRALPRGEIQRADLLRSRLTELHPSTFLMRRDTMVEGFGLVDEELPGSYAEDYELLLRAASHGPILNIPAIQARIRWHEKSHFAHRWGTIAQALPALLERHPDFRAVPKGYARVAGQIAFARAALGHRREALRWVRQTVRANPLEPRAYLSLAVAGRLLGVQAILRTLHAKGRGL